MKLHILAILCALCTCHSYNLNNSRPKRTINMFEDLIKSMRSVLNTQPESSTMYVSPPVRIRANTPPKRIIYIKRYPMPNPKRRKPQPKRLSNKKPSPQNAKFASQKLTNHIPWSLSPLPPPLPTSKPSDPADDPPIPWNLHALPPPMATKGTQTEQRPAKKKARAKKKSTEQQPSLKPDEQKQRKKNPQKKSSPFVSSPLQSEISVQPAIEIASYTETLTSQETNPARNKQLIGPHFRIPRDINHANGLNDSRTTVEKFSNNTNPPTSKITTSSTSWSISRKGGIHQHSNVTSTETPDEAKNLPPLVKEYPSTEPMPFSLPSLIVAKNSRKQKFSTHLFPTMPNDKPYTELDFGEYADNTEADRELASAASNPQVFSTQPTGPSPSFTIIKSPDVLNYHEMSPNDRPRLVEITPRTPYCATSYPPTAFVQIDHRLQEKQDVEKQSTINSNTFTNKPFSHRDELFPPDNQPFKYNSDLRSLNKPKESLFDSNFGRTRLRTNPNKWSTSKSKVVSFTDRIVDGKKWNPGSLIANNLRTFGGDDKIEFFEPIVIDIEKDNNKVFDFQSGFDFKRKQKSKKLFNEPLKLPDSLHETMNFLQKSIMRPPPIFDVE